MLNTKNILITAIVWNHHNMKYNILFWFDYIKQGLTNPGSKYRKGDFRGAHFWFMCAPSVGTGWKDSVTRETRGKKELLLKHSAF